MAKNIPQASQALTAFFQSRRVRPDGPPVALAVSGGADSMALIAAWAAMTPETRPRAIVCHVQHGLRGKESDQDQALVEKVCAGLDLPLELKKVKLGRGNALEEKARLARQRAFRQVASKHGARWILLGHHARDRAETLLMNLSRGGGLRGAAAPRPASPLEGGEGLMLGRPFLSLDPDQLRKFNRERKMPWREDRSNRDTRFNRNRMRHQVLPLLEKAWPGAVQALAAFAEQAGDSSDWIEATAERALDQRLDKSGALDLRAFGRDPWLDRQILLAWTRRTTRKMPDRAGLERLEDLVSQGQGSVNLRSGRVARIRRGRLVIT